MTDHDCSHPSWRDGFLRVLPLPGDPPHTFAFQASASTLVREIVVESSQAIEAVLVTVDGVAVPERIVRVGPIKLLAGQVLSVRFDGRPLAVVFKYAAAVACDFGG